MKDLLIVVPYRNREEHLKGFLENSPKFFNQTGLTYDILICELEQIGDWNAGLCVNSLVDFINEKRCYEWLYIHHVDVWPVSGQWEFPPEKQVFFNMGDYGSCLMKLQTFFDIDGYSNNFWGWGGEDNELYEKLRQDGYLVIDYSKKNSEASVLYNTQFQNHPRNFNGRNYANAIKQNMLIPRSKRSNIHTFSEHGSTSELIEIQPRIFRQIVHPKQKSPDQTVNKNLLITYITDTSSFNKFITYTKSAQLQAAYEFDMAAIIATDDMSSWCVNQLQTFGIQCISQKSLLKEWDPPLNKFTSYLRFLENDQTHEFILHVDSNNTYFQTNPFFEISKTSLTLQKQNNTISTSCFAGPKHSFLEFCENMVATDKIEFDSIANKLSVELAHDNWCVDLKQVANYSILGNREIRNSANTRYSIVYNYEAHSEFATTIDKHFKEFYSPLCY